MNIDDIWNHDPSVYVIAEVGINHNGDIEMAKGLIKAAKLAGADAVKFQKRTVGVVYTAEELAKPRENPFGPTNGDLKRGLEFGAREYNAIAKYCLEVGIDWFASCWDEASVDFIQSYDPVCYKIASASITDVELLKHTCAMHKPIILSTGMCEWPHVDGAVRIIESYGNPLVIQHCVSTYPSKDEELNLSCLLSLRDRYQVPIGYSGHEHGLATTVAAVALGACCVERHITLDRSMWGSDHAASIEPAGFARMVRDIRAVEQAMGDGVKRMLPSEVPIAAKLRRVG